MSHDPNQVIDTPADDYVLPAPPRSHAELIFGEEPSTARAVRSTAAVARAFGERLVLKAECMGSLLGELREQLEQLDGAIAEASRAQLKGAVRELSHVVDWCEAMRSELADEGALACDGREPIDLGRFCEELAAGLQATTDPIAVRSIGLVTVWCDRAALAHLIEQALAVVWARTGGVGLRCLEVGSDDGVPRLRVRSRGEPSADVEPGLVDAFRNTAGRVGVRVLPDDLGLGSPGLVLAFDPPA